MEEKKEASSLPISCASGDRAMERGKGLDQRGLERQEEGLDHLDCTLEHLKKEGLVTRASNLTEFRLMMERKEEVRTLQWKKMRKSCRHYLLLRRP